MSFSKKVKVNCKDCNKDWLKRLDTLSFWEGRCRSCSQKFELAQPSRKLISSITATKTRTKYGAVPNAVKFTSEMTKGEKNNHWKGGITPLNQQIRHSKQYFNWRNEVFKRDNWTCIWCGFKGYVEADHIKPFAYFPALRFELSNGRTLCKNCHMNTVTYKQKIKVVEIT